MFKPRKKDRPVATFVVDVYDTVDGRTPDALKMYMDQMVRSHLNLSGFSTAGLATVARRVGDG